MNKMGATNILAIDAVLPITEDVIGRSAPPRQRIKTTLAPAGNPREKTRRRLEASTVLSWKAFIGEAPGTSHGGAFRQH